MKIDKLSIGFAGYAKKIGAFQKNNIIEGYVILTQDDWHNNKYYDILTGKGYFESTAWEVNDGDAIVVKPESLYLLLTRLCNKYPELEKYTKKKKLKTNEIKELLLFLNNNVYKKESDSYINSLDKKETQGTDNNKNANNQNNNSLDFINILTNKKFKTEPCIGRENELYEIIIALATEKKNVILVGPSGTGKTAICEQLAYKIQQNDIPNFLKNKKIIELNLFGLLADTRLAGVLEEKFASLVNYAINNNAILFIDEIHNIYGAGTHDKSNYDIAAMIKQAIDRQGLKIISTTTTEEYEKYFSNDALKRRFEKIIIKEPDNKTLYQIINKVFNDYSKNSNIKLLENMNKIINCLIDLTDSKHRTWNDKVCNPDLVIQ